MNLKALLIAILFFPTLNLGFSQDSKNFPKLDELESYCEFESNIEFLKAVRKYDFSFEQKQNVSYGTDYIYVRNTSKDGIVYTDRIIYQDFDNGINLVQVVTTMSNLWILYEEKIEQDYNTAKCSRTTSENELQSCYSNKSNFIRLIDTRKRFSSGTDGNEYAIMINN